MQRFLFVCLGNICRSPAGAAVLREHVSEHPRLSSSVVASCGMGAWHLGQLADARMRQAALERGFDLSDRAQQFDLRFFEEFDYILAVDRGIRSALLELAGDSEHAKKIQLVCAFSGEYPDHDIPDPYYGDGDGFKLVLDMLDDACIGLIRSMEGSF